MESNEVVLTSRSIQHILKSYNPEKAISEYIYGMALMLMLRR